MINRPSPIGICTTIPTQRTVPVLLGSRGEDLEGGTPLRTNNGLILSSLWATSIVTLTVRKLTPWRLCASFFLIGGALAFLSFRRSNGPCNSNTRPLSPPAEKLGPDDLSPRLRCSLEEAGVAKQGIDTYLQRMTLENREKTQELPFNRVGLYFFAGLTSANPEDKVEPDTMFMLMTALLHDVDASRAEDVKQFFRQQGCGAMERNRECLEKGEKMEAEKGRKLTPEEGKVIIGNDPACHHLIEDLTCMTKVTLEGFRHESDRMDVEGGLIAHRQAHADIVYTNLQRMGALGSAVEQGKEIGVKFPAKVRRILVVGPGLEMINPAYSFLAPSQTFEPFAVVDLALSRFGATIDTLEVDLLDISSRVIKHLQGAIQKAQSCEPYPVYLYDNSTNQTGKPIPFGQHIPGVVRKSVPSLAGYRREILTIPSRVLGRLRPIEGDITTDRVAEADHYDLVVMMNLFMYLDEEQKRLALDNIGRLLSKGGILLTDSDSLGGESVSNCNVQQDSGLKPGPTVINSADLRTPLVFWTKE